MSDHKQEESFRVIDRRPFTSEGELRREIVEEQEREAKKEASKPVGAAQETKTSAAPPSPDLPKAILRPRKTTCSWTCSENSS